MAHRKHRDWTVRQKPLPRCQVFTILHFTLTLYEHKAKPKRKIQNQNVTYNDCQKK